MKTNNLFIIALAAGLSVSMLAPAREKGLVTEMKGVSHKQKGFAYQGMDYWKGKVLSCQNQGIATIYDLSGPSVEICGQFNLASFNKCNHANVASFGTEKICKDDPFPVVYVSHCHKKTIDGMKDLCFVERISPDMNSSTLVQTIFYNDVNKDFGYALQWVVDREKGFLYGYGNTVDNSSPENRHRVIKFRLPALSEGSMVTLNPEDALENYTIEEVSGYKFNPIGQGLDIRKGKLYMPTGLGTGAHPSILYIWDLEKRQMEAVDLSESTTGELEDIAVLSKRKLLLQSQDGLFIVGR